MPWNRPVTACRQAELDLRGLAAEVGERHEQAGEEDAERVQRPRNATMIAVKP